MNYLKEKSSILFDSTTHLVWDILDNFIIPCYFHVLNYFNLDSDIDIEIETDPQMDQWLINRGKELLEEMRELSSQRDERLGEEDITSYLKHQLECVEDQVVGISGCWH